MVAGHPMGVRDQFVICARELHMGDWKTFISLRSRDRVYLAEKAVGFMEDSGSIRSMIGAFMGG